MLTTVELCCRTEAAMPQPIIFVGGVHGAGKTTLSKRLAEFLPAAHVTAGSLIREAASAEHVVTVGAQDKAVLDVNANQVALLRGLAAYQARTSDDRPLLLDGHFTLTSPENEIVDVPSAVFAAIAPVAVLLVRTNPAVVHQRLAARAPEAPAPDLIVRLAERENERANATANALTIPIFTLAGDASGEQDLQVVVDTLRRRLRGLA